MSELYKAMKRIEDYQSTKPLYKQIAEIKGIASTARYGYDIQPQLTIPESIADDLDKIPNEAKRYVQENGFDDYSILDDFVELREFYEADEDDIFPKFMELKDFVKDNLNLCVIYLAGKALGVELVKVVEG
ncbi:hypothetical protein EFE21_10115 [Lactococcus lactis subsp. lactis]|uniref:hypothetical protein n=1 Tax=Lactococcus lactis TaxID=1358 RepID=UPI00223B53FC|nr:hypothetical protein [Lactococcus lactis]MCT0033119.1 hypothetical protein [Lactococcus lactis subsp. lactis]